MGAWARVVDDYRSAIRASADPRMRFIVLCQPTLASKGCGRRGAKWACPSSKSEHLPELGELFFGKRPRLFIQVRLIQANEPGAVDPVRSG